LVPEQVTLTDAVSCYLGQCDARNPTDLFSQNQ
jgi:hypothetical protein